MVLSLSRVRFLQCHGLQPARLLFPWDFPGKNPGVGCHFLLQGIFPIQGLNPPGEPDDELQDSLFPLQRVPSECPAG